MPRPDVSAGARAGPIVMDLLTAPPTLRRAGLAALATTTACVPKLAGWTNSPFPLWFSALTIALTSAVMWAFVFAWEEPRLGRAPLALVRAWGFWLAVTGFALTAAAYRMLVLDPALVAAGLVQRPASLGEWAAAGLFQMAFWQLFLLCAPTALCARLFRDRRAAVVLVVGLGLYTGWQMIARHAEGPSAALTQQILLGRAVGDGLSVWCYQRGGLPAAWWIALVLHLRLLPGLLLGQ